MNNKHKKLLLKYWGLLGWTKDEKGDWYHPNVKRNCGGIYMPYPEFEEQLPNPFKNSDYLWKLVGELILYGWSIRFSLILNKIMFDSLYSSPVSCEFTKDSLETGSIQSVFCECVLQAWIKEKEHQNEMKNSLPSSQESA